MGDLTSHGMKATALSFLAKWGVGHHSLRNRSSLECYSRDIQAGPLRVLDQCLKAVRIGSFLPDVARSGYIALPTQCANSRTDSGGFEVVDQPDPGNGSAAAEFSSAAGRTSPCDGQASPEETPCEAAESEGESSSDSSSSSSSSGSGVDQLENAVCLTAGLEVPEWKPTCTIFQHRRTKTMHLLAAGVETSFLRGRKRDQERTQFTGAFLVDSWKCKQCDKGRPIRAKIGCAQVLDRALKRVKKS